MWDSAAQVTALISAHLARRPGMQPRDIYKLLYQGVRGPEHLITSPQAFREYLAAEWQSLTSTGDDPLTESIHPDGSLLRLNLRPFKAAGGSLEALTTACLETALRAWGTQDELQRAWAFFIDVCKTGYWSSVPLQEVEVLTSQIEANNYPPIHHSDQYRRLYKPAYRLVAAEFELHTHP